MGGYTSCTPGDAYDLFLSCCAFSFPPPSVDLELGRSVASEVFRFQRVLIGASDLRQIDQLPLKEAGKDTRRIKGHFGPLVRLRLNYVGGIKGTGHSRACSQGALRS